MKKLFTLIITCIFAGIVLSSCKQGISIMKRHYTDGYYVSHSGKKQSPSEKKETKKIPETKLPEYVSQDAVAENRNSINTKPTGNNSNEVEVAANDNLEPQKTKILKQEIQGGSSFRSDKKQIKFNAVPDLKKIVNAADEREGLSLFWIVILILLILWALGFGLGIGDIIHVLLVIALVLLILWLLRIL